MGVVVKKVRPDSKGRIILGKFAKNVSSFDITEDDQGRIILTPYKEIPLREAWLYENKEALKSVKKGLKDSAAGDTVSKGSFSQYVDDELE